jgi:protein-L-isoaspartate(D-aspartate) O-methyltransferase
MLAETVFSIERVAELARRSHDVLRRAGITNVSVMHGDGTLGFKSHAPYHGIVVAAAAPAIPAPLVAQLVPGGRLVIPVASPNDVGETLTLVVRHMNGPGYDATPVTAVRFVPLLGEFGYTPPES